jgi:hypothetical protein
MRGQSRALLSLAQLSFADSKSLETAKQELRAIKDAGRIPGFADYVNLLNREDLQFTDRDLFGTPKAPIGLLPFLQSLQEPEISRETLAERIEAKRARIKSYVIEVSLSRSPGLQDGGDGKSAMSAVGWCRARAGVSPETTSFDGQSSGISRGSNQRTFTRQLTRLAGLGFRFL